MIIWIASYPRSGNTLTSQLIYRCFEYKTYEKYNNFGKYIKIGTRSQIIRLLGLIKYDLEWKDFYQQAKDSEEIFFIKTHDAPEDNSPCIYVVRNPYHATESFYSYHRDVLKKECLWEDLISGSVFPFHTWGSHLDNWNPTLREMTILIKYEDIISQSEKVTEKISEFAKINIKQKWINNFSAHQKIDPEFFRKGNQNSASLFPNDKKGIFNAINLDWLIHFDYIEKSEICFNDLKLFRKKMNEMCAGINSRDLYIEEIKKNQLDRKSKVGILQNLFKIIAKQ